MKYPYIGEGADSIGRVCVCDEKERRVWHFGKIDGGGALRHAT